MSSSKQIVKRTVVVAVGVIKGCILANCKIIVNTNIVISIRHISARTGQCEPGKTSPGIMK